MEILKGPYLQWPTQNSMTIMWETSFEASSQVTYYETQKVAFGINGRFKTLEESEMMVKDDDMCRIHRIILMDLKIDTTYHYKVCSKDKDGNGAESDLYPLKTSVEENASISFAVTSENGPAGSGPTDINDKLFSQILHYRPEFLLLVGDAVNSGSRYEDWEQTLFKPGKELLSKTPFYLCLGNHEENARWYYDFVGYPEPKNFYSFDYGNAHFICLDCTSEQDYMEGSFIPMEVGEGFMPGSRQYEFLINDLKACRATWKIVFFHYPPFVSGDYQVEEMRVLCPVFEKYKVDIVFNSHTKVYERSHPIRNGKIDFQKGVVYVVAGGAGVNFGWFHHKRAWHTAQAFAAPHFVQVVIAGRRLELQVIDWEGRLRDVSTMNKAYRRR